MLSAYILSGCHESANREAGALFQSIYADYLHGTLDVAEARAEKARREFSRGRPSEKN